MVCRCLVLLIFLFTGPFVDAQRDYTAAQIPNPKINGNGFVSNPDAILSASDLAALNHSAAELEQQTKVEVAIVVVRDFDRDKDDFTFASDLFKSWGVGKSKANNGLLLLVATDRKQYRFITGYGLEGLLPDAVLKRIGDHFLVPSFKAGAYGTGTIAAVYTISEYLRQPENKKELEQLLTKDIADPVGWPVSMGMSVIILIAAVFIAYDFNKKTPSLSPEDSKKIIGYDKVTGIGCMGLIAITFALVFLSGLNNFTAWIKLNRIVAVPALVYLVVSFILFLRYMTSLSAFRKNCHDDANFTSNTAWFNRRARWYVLFSPLIIIVMIIEENRRRSVAGRFIPQLDAQQHPMMRIDRDENINGAPYLNPGQIAEEQNGVSVYDIWVNADQSEFRVIRQQGSQFSAFTDCPECHFRTLAPTGITIVVQPSFSKEGSGKKVKVCKNCGYEELVKMITIPVLSTNSNGAGSSGTSGSGGSDASSGSGSSGSFGGGSSGGGGAGGSW